MRSGQLAGRAGVSTDTLRHYERLGLLPAPARTAGNYRDYPAQAVARVSLIRNALAAGFTLKELGGILRVRDQGGVPCHEVRRLAAEKLVALSRRIAELTAYRARMEQVLAHWDDRLRQTGPGKRALLLEMLVAVPVDAPHDKVETFLSRQPHRTGQH
jgi:MerR family transcriptional regulator, copper efflux regulator